MGELSNGSMRLFYEEFGVGPAVLWHTGGCGDHEMWLRAGYVDALPGYRHLLMDHRGHGRSGTPTSIDEHSMDHYMADVIAVLNHADVKNAAIIGYSFGARVAYAAAASSPERFWAVVGLDSMPPHESEVNELRSDAAIVRERGTRSIIEEMADSESEAPPSWLVEHLCRTDSDAFAGAFEAFATARDFWRAAPQTVTPTLFIVGVKGDALEKERLAREAAAIMPNGQFEVLRGQGHLQTFWKSDLTIPLIREFLRSWSDV